MYAGLVFAHQSDFLPGQLQRILQLKSQCYYVRLVNEKIIACRKNYYTNLIFWLNYDFFYCMLSLKRKIIKNSFHRVKFYGWSSKSNTKCVKTIKKVHTKNPNEWIDSNELTLINVVDE